jgi:hypothetical protein
VLPRIQRYRRASGVQDRMFLRGLGSRVLELGGESGMDRHPTVHPGSYVEYVQKLGHEAPGIYSLVLLGFVQRLTRVDIEPIWRGELAPGGCPTLLVSQAAPARRVPLDKSEGGVKDKNILSVFSAPLFCQRGLRTKTLEISR